LNTVIVKNRELRLNVPSTAMKLLRLSAISAVHDRFKSIFLLLVSIQNDTWA